MPVIKAADLAYGRLRSPDLDKQEEFLTAFGMVRAERTNERALHARHRRAAPPPRHRAGRARNMSASRFMPRAWTISKSCRAAEGASKIENIDEPGGGKRVRLTDPDGFQVEVIHGMEMLPKIPVQRPPVNTGEDKTQRRNALYYKGVERGPSHVKRIGHFVVHSPQFEKTLGWYREMFGLRCLRRCLCRRARTTSSARSTGSTAATILSTTTPSSASAATRRGSTTFSYEAADIDDIMIGHEHLQGKGYEHFWGLGRHSLGSQVFDYWGDPWGRVHEHWADTDVLNASVPPNLIGREELAGPWGGPPPEKFMHHAVRCSSGGALAPSIRAGDRVEISLSLPARDGTAEWLSREPRDEHLCALRPAVHRRTRTRR